MPTLAPLARHPGLVATLCCWLRDEWPEWYGPGGRGDALADATAFAASETALPVGFVAFEGGEPVGFAALKAESLRTHRHLGPWAAAGLVLPPHRGKGIGGHLLAALVRHAGVLGFERVYCGTATAANLLRRSGWSELELVPHDGQCLVLFEKKTGA